MHCDDVEARRHVEMELLGLAGSGGAATTTDAASPHALPAPSRSTLFLMM